jgi:hypothetical protein
VTQARPGGRGDGGLQLGGRAVLGLDTTRSPQADEAVRLDRRLLRHLRRHQEIDLQPVADTQPIGGSGVAPGRKALRFALDRTDVLGGAAGGKQQERGQKVFQSHR